MIHAQVRPPRGGLVFYNTECYCGKRFKAWDPRKVQLLIDEHIRKEGGQMSDTLLAGAVDFATPPKYVQWIDITGTNSLKVPASSALGLIELYATGSDGIEATAAERLRFQKAGVGIILIDQTPSLSIFASGWADVADIEFLAGTFTAAVAACLERQKHGWLSTLYVSQGQWNALTNALHDGGVDLSLVRYGIANWSDSVMTAEEFMAANPSVAYVQYGDNVSNKNTPVPGLVGVTVGDVAADIDVGNWWWASQFYPKKPPVPVPVGPFRHELGPDETIAQFAASRDVNVTNLFARSVKLWTPADQALIENGRMVVYTVNP